MSLKSIRTEANTLEYFRKYGFIIVPNALNARHVVEVRAFLDDHWAALRAQHENKGKRMMWPGEVLALPELYKLPFTDSIVKGLKTVLGNPYSMFTDFQVQRNGFGQGKYKGWHTDSGSEGKAAYLCAPDYAFVKCGLYLQDNTEDWGGGIDIVPGGHRFPIRTPIPKANFFFKSLMNRIESNTKAIQVALEAGDFVAFDSRLPHTSTYPNRASANDGSEVIEVPAEHTKYVLYWNSCNQQSAKDFLMNSIRRGEQELQQSANELYFTDYLRRAYPDGYPKDFVEAAERHGVRIVSLPSTEAAKWQAGYQRQQSRGFLA